MYPRMPFRWSQAAAIAACVPVQCLLNSSSEILGFRCCITVTLSRRSLVGIFENLNGLLLSISQASRGPELRIKLQGGGGFWTLNIPNNISSELLKVNCGRQPISDVMNVVCSIPHEH